MDLTANTLSDLDTRVAVPSYDRSAVTGGIVHLGVGGFHRAHEAMYVDALLNAGLATDWGITGVGLLAQDRPMLEVMRAQDCLYTLVVKQPDGSSEARVIGSIIGYLFAPEDPAAVLDRLTDPATRIVSLTVTEGGYHVNEADGSFDDSDPAIQADLTGDGTPTTAFGFITEALARRRAAGTDPFAVMSCDNIEGNGDLTRAMVTAFATLLDAELGTWIGETVAFPNSMVDRITPATTDADRRLVADEYGIDDGWPVVCESFAQWALENRFPLGRPELERVGVQVVEDVRPYELMKLRLLNASHQALGYLGYLSGHRYVHEVCNDPLFIEFLRGYMDHEATPTLAAVPGVDLDAYKDQLMERFASAQIKDTLARLCAFSSDRIPKWLVPVIRHQLANGGQVRRSALVVAAWARYAEGLDEAGDPIEVVERRDGVLQRAQRQAQHPLAFLDDQHLFADLQHQPGFTAHYLEALESLHSVGARATLEAWRD